MATIHTAGLLLADPAGGARPSPVPGGAVLVNGREIAAVGPFEELAAAHPRARVRRWPGLLAPGLLNPYGPELLERAYHPDPREAGELGGEPLTGAALAALPMTDTRWGASARRGAQRMLAHGTVAVAGPLRAPAVADAVRRSGLRVLPRTAEPEGAPSLDPLAGCADPLAVMPLPLGGPGADATFAVFDVDGLPALAAGGAATCVATVVAGRLVHRRR
ncbi:imidazolonepropionase-like domain-containing protein [Streptomyces minutiscleroticus]|uniref:Aminodeoxyfutalosine deaminase/Imidazolonepropionase-like composite domain-containing protein n=1 Tax=Streptomyces minutiscleroticus TaxID=68238 RepID=A0A918KI86_9ACTN|nr:hypothetical protein [Streptomyces minutiscleroticus]GGX62685.1 hypothetical protein GCM10010358_16340 [Streptomyces minutiscleroticus]